MPKIEINELDLTTPGVASESTDVVFIPGFVDATQTSLSDGDGNYIGLKAFKPHLFTSVAEFNSLCGKVAPTFAEDQLYSDLGIGKFDSKAIPEDGIMFEEGTADPSYVMAKELLAAGISVLYERVNETSGQTETYNKVTGATADKIKDMTNDGSISTYYYKDANGDYINYSTPNSITAPAFPTTKSNLDAYSIVSVSIDTLTQEKWAEKVTGTEVIYCNTLYQLNGDNKYESVFKTANDGSNPTLDKYKTDNPDVKTFYTFVQLTSKPADWDTSYSNYAKKDGNYFVAYVASTTTYTPFDVDNLYTQYMKDAISHAAMYDALSKVFDASAVDGLADRGNYSIKYLTSGGYPVYEYDNGSIVTAMLGLAENRGDCVALIDHTDNPKRSIDPATGKNSVFDSLVTNKDSFTNGDFGAMFTPWATYNRVTSDADKTDSKKSNKAPFRAPASFAYLAALADSIKTNANWLAIAGASRGGVRNLALGGMDVVIPNGVADAMQPRSNSIAINAITNINPYGLTIWGNRTLKPVEENLVATNFLNIRNLISDIKKTCYRAARKATFEQDTDVLWINFKSDIAKLLDRMKSGYGISGYKIVRDYDHEKSAENATLCAKIVIYPTYAVEDFYITVILRDDEVTVQ